MPLSRGRFVAFSCAVALHIAAATVPFDIASLASLPPQEGLALVQVRASVLRAEDAARQVKAAGISQDSFVMVDGVIGAGNDIFSETTTVQAAMERCVQIPQCEGFTVEGNPLSNAGPSMFHYKSNNDVVRDSPAGAATSYRRLRAVPSQNAELAVRQITSAPAANQVFAESQLASAASQAAGTLAANQAATGTATQSSVAKAYAAMRMAADASQASAAQSTLVSRAAAAKAAADGAVAEQATAAAAKANAAATESTATEKAAVEQSAIDIAAAEQAAEEAVRTKAAAVEAVRVEEAVSSRLAIDGAAAEQAAAQAAMATAASAEAKAVADAAANKAAVTSATSQLTNAAVSATMGVSPPVGVAAMGLSLLQMPVDTTPVLEAPLAYTLPAPAWGNVMSEAPQPFPYAAPQPITYAAMQPIQPEFADQAGQTAADAAETAQQGAQPAQPAGWSPEMQLPVDTTATLQASSAYTMPASAVAEPVPYPEMQLPVDTTATLQASSAYSMPASAVAEPVAYAAPQPIAYAVPQLLQPALADQAGQTAAGGAQTAQLGPQPAGWGPEMTMPDVVQPAGWGGQGQRRPTAERADPIETSALVAEAQLARTLVPQVLPELIEPQSSIPSILPGPVSIAAPGAATAFQTGATLSYAPSPIVLPQDSQVAS